MYSPTRSKKKNAITMRSATAFARREAVGQLDGAAAAAIVSTGSASWGRGAGSASFKLFSVCLKAKSSSLAPYDRRGSGNPASTRACPT